MFYTEAQIDRKADKRSDPDFIAMRLSNPETMLLPVWRGQNLIDNSGDTPRAGGFTVAEGSMLMAEGGDTVLLVDADSVIHPDCPNFFLETNHEFSSQLCNGDYEWVNRAIHGYSRLFFDCDYYKMSSDFFQTCFVILNEKVSIQSPEDPSL